MDDGPSVSILIPSLNEVSNIDLCLASVLAQTYPLREVVVLDGGSTDGTRERVSSYGGLVRLVDNPGRGPAAAMNNGIAASSGDIICRMDAHAVLDPDYVESCVNVLLETGAEVVGGPMRPRGRGSFGQAVAAVTSSRAAMPGRFHFGTSRADVDTVYLGSWRRSTLIDAGGFDAEHFPRVGEDYDLNYRIRCGGGRVVLDPSLRSTYWPRESPRALWWQYYRYGLAKAASVARHGALPSWRPVAPAGLVALSVGGLMAGRTRSQKRAVPLVHALACFVVGGWVGANADVDPLKATVVLEISHWAFGIGFWIGMGRILCGRPVQDRLVTEESSSSMPARRTD